MLNQVADGVWVRQSEWVWSKTDAADAHSVALVGARMAGLRPVVNDEQLTVLRILVDRRPRRERSTPGWCASSTSCCWS